MQKSSDAKGVSFGARARQKHRRTVTVRTVAFAFIATHLLWGDVTPPENPVEGHLSLSAASEITARQLVRAHLEDGSLLIARKGARLSLPKPREISLASGDLCLTVAKRGEPFVIGTQNAKVIVTEGLILVSQGEETEATVSRGEAALLNDMGMLPFGPGDKVIARAGAAPAKSPAERFSHLIGWAREAFQQPEPEKSAIEDRTWRLVWKDGAEQEASLELRKYHVDVYIEDGIARTTVDQTFFNQLEERVEGTFYFPLPPDSSVSRLGMYVNGRLMEGGMVERTRGQRIYNTIRYQRRDPALLELMEGNIYKLRIFPIEPRQEKRIFLSYTQTLPDLYGTLTYWFPMAHTLPRVRDLTIRVRVRDGDRLYTPRSETHKLYTRHDGNCIELEYREQDARPDRDLLLRLEPKTEPPAASFAAFRDEGTSYVYARVRPTISGEVDNSPKQWVILNDVSGSRTMADIRTQSVFARHLVSQMGSADAVALINLNTQVDPVTAGFVPAGSSAARKLAALASVDAPLGATNIVAGLQTSTDLILGAHAYNPHVVYLGDGIVTDGPRKASETAKLLPKGTTFIGVSVGKRGSPRLLQGLADATGGLQIRIGPDEDLRWRALDLLAALRTPRMVRITAVFRPGNGGTIDLESYLSSRTLSQGEALTIVGRGEDLPEALSISGMIGSTPYAKNFRIHGAKRNAQFIPRLWATRHINELLSSGSLKRSEIVRHSKQYYVMTPYTSLLVLEDEWMYGEFGVERGRDDHWALYSAPREIPVVGEPSTLGHPEARSASPETRSRNGGQGHWPDSVWKAVRSLQFRKDCPLYSWPVDPFVRDRVQLLRYLTGKRPSPEGPADCMAKSDPFLHAGWSRYVGQVDELVRFVDVLRDSQPRVHSWPPFEAQAPHWRQRLESQMATKIDINFRDESLSEVIRYLSRETGTNIVLDLFAVAGWDAKVTLTGRWVRLRTVLDWIARQTNMVHVLHDGAICLTTADRFPERPISRTYDICDLIAWSPDASAGTQSVSGGGSGAVYREAPTASIFGDTPRGWSDLDILDSLTSVPPSIPDGPPSIPTGQDSDGGDDLFADADGYDEDYPAGGLTGEDLVELIVETVSPRSWLVDRREQGFWEEEEAEEKPIGRGSATYGQGKLLVRQTPTVHREVRQLLDKLRAGSDSGLSSIEESSRPFREQEIFGALEEPVSFDFCGERFPVAVRCLAEQTGVNIVLDPKASPECERVVLKVSQMKLRSALNWLVGLAGLAYVIRDQAIFISTRDQAQEELVLGIYDVTDLISPAPYYSYFQWPVDNGYGFTSEGEFSYPDRDAVDILDDADDWADLIMDTVSPSNWEWTGWSQEDEQTPTVGFSQGQLNIKATPTLHRQIEEILSAYRGAVSQKLLGEAGDRPQGETIFRVVNALGAYWDPHLLAVDATPYQAAPAPDADALVSQYEAFSAVPSGALGRELAALLSSSGDKPDKRLLTRVIQTVEYHYPGMVAALELDASDWYATERLTKWSDLSVEIRQPPWQGGALSDMAIVNGPALLSGVRGEGALLHGTYSRLPWVQVLQGDAVYTDLTRYAPAFRSDLFDVLDLAYGESHPEYRTGVMSAPARERIKLARKAIQPQTIQLRDGAEFHIGKADRFAWERKTKMLLEELMACDGENIVLCYPELGLAARRSATDLRLALLRSRAPHLLEPPWQLTRGCDVSLAEDERDYFTLDLIPLSRRERLRPLDGPRYRVRLVVGNDGRVRRRTWSQGRTPVLEQSFSYRGTTVTIETTAARGRKLRRASFEVCPLAPAESTFRPDLADYVVFDAPLNVPAVYAEQLRSLGNSPERRGERVRALRHFALACLQAHAHELQQRTNWGRDPHAYEALDRLLEELAGSGVKGKLADLVLMGCAGYGNCLPHWIDQAEADASHPVLSYFLQLHTDRQGYADLARRASNTLIGHLASYHAAVCHPMATELTRFSEHYGSSPLLLAAAFNRAKARHDAESWYPLFASSKWRGVAIMMAARCARSREEKHTVTEAFIRYHRQMAEEGHVVPVPPGLSRFLREDDGRAWQAVVRSALKTALLKDEFVPLVRFADFAMAHEEDDLADVALARAEALLEADLSYRLLLVLAQTYARGGNSEKAYDRYCRLLAALDHEGIPPSSGLLLAAGKAAAESSKASDAIELGERAFDLLISRKAGPLGRVATSNVCHWLYDQYGARLRELSGRTHQDEVRSLLARAATRWTRWRKMDSQNPSQVKQLATLYLLAGRKEEAWAAISTLIEWKPRDASSYEDVAQWYLDRARPEAAEQFYAKAFECQPTNPRWLYERARILSKTGREEEARAIYRTVADGNWIDWHAEYVGKARQALRN